MTTQEKAKEVVSYFNKAFLHTRLNVTPPTLDRKLLGKVEFTESEVEAVNDYYSIVVKSQKFDAKRLK